MTPEEFWKILHSVSEPAPVSYRLYYDTATGMPLFYSMEDCPGTYIEIDQATFGRSPTNVRVKNGQLIEITHNIAQKLTPGSGTCCHPKNVAVVVDESQPHVKWSKRIYETD